MGLETAIIGSSLISGASSIFGGRAASSAISSGVDSANQNIYNATDYAQNVLTGGINEAANTLSPWRQIGATGRNALLGTDPNINIDPYSNINPYSQVDVVNDRDLTSGLNPYIDVGPTPLSGSADEVMDRFYASPDYEFRRSEGLRDTSNMMNNTYGLGSGNALKALTDYSSDLAAGEFDDWARRATGDFGLQYGVAADNYGRAYGQEAADLARLYGQDIGNIERLYGQESDDFSRAYGQEFDDYNRAYGQATDNFTRNYGLASDLTNLGLGADMSWLNSYGNFSNNLANNALNAGYGYANNLMGGAVNRANVYQGVAEGVNNAATSGIGNWLYTQGAGFGQQTQPMYDFQGRLINYEI